MKFFRRIEFYLIASSLCCFSLIFWFKGKTEARFNDFEIMLNTFLMEKNPQSAEVFFEGFEKEFEPLIFLDDEIKTLAAGMKADSVYGDGFRDNLLKFHNRIKTLRQKMSLSYDSILYESIFFLVLAVVIILNRNFDKIQKLSKINLMNDVQNQISRDLHDTVIQDLKLLKLYLDKNDDESNSMREFYLNQAYNEARYLMSSINDIDLKSDFIEILRKVTRNFELNHKIRTQFFEATTLIHDFDLSRKAEIYRIFQESFSNIARHANADTVTVKIIDSVMKEKQSVKIIISDNGIGIKDADFEKENHYGLKNIKERVERSGGTMMISSGTNESGEKRGTTITIEY